MFGWKPCACATGSTKISSLAVATYLTTGPVTKYCYVHPARTHAPRARERGLRPHLQSARMYRAHLRPPAPPVHTPAHIDPTCDAQQDRVLTHTTIHTPNRRGSLSPTPPPPAGARAAQHFPCARVYRHKGHAHGRAVHTQARHAVAPACSNTRLPSRSGDHINKPPPRTVSSPSCMSGVERLCSGAASALTRCA